MIIKKFFYCLFVIIILSMILSPPLKEIPLEIAPLVTPKEPITFSPDEQNYIQSQAGKTLLLGLDPYSGMDYFENFGVKYGYIHEVVNLIEKETGLQIDIVGDQSWGEVVDKFNKGDIDILFGANATTERLKYMVFSDPIIQTPYAAFSRKNSDVRTVADFDHKTIAFVENDSASTEFTHHFDKIKPNIVFSFDQITALESLCKGDIDGFVTPGGAITNQFLYNYPDVEMIAEINSITSDMTLSTLKEDVVLRDILQKVLSYYSDTEIKDALKQAEINFNCKILHLTQKEIQWLKEDGTAVAGMADNYLPFDYYEMGQYKGIGGAVLTKSCDLVGIEIIGVVSGDFSLVYQDAVDGKIDVINMSKSEERLNHFFFTKPFSFERDMIYGKKDMPFIQDIYGLEGKHIAVIPGFWQYDSLRKNLSNVYFVEAPDTPGCLELIRRGKADYFIENPTVAEFYISGLGYPDIIEKGVTASDSFQYLAIHKSKPELASILDKSLQLVSYEKEKYNGLQDIPNLTPIRYKKMSFIIGALIITITLISIFVFRTLKKLTEERVQTHILKERNQLLFFDPLTGVKNRASFYDTVQILDDMKFPQTFVTVDINDLKNINDNYGHYRGDLLIKTCSTILKKVYPGDFIYRMGGDEFLIIYFPDSLQQKLHDVATLHKISRQTPLIDGQCIVREVSMAVGFASRESKVETVEDVLKRSDNEMYANKRRMKSAKEML